jgi:hypothetical protein
MLSPFQRKKVAFCRSTNKVQQIDAMEFVNFADELVDRPTLVEVSCL